MNSLLDFKVREFMNQVSVFDTNLILTVRAHANHAAVISPGGAIPPACFTFL